MRAEPPPPADRAAGGPTRAADADALVDVLDSLRHELEGMRSQARLHAVIEQAKGLLAAEHGISPAEAFERLRAISQEHNVRIVEVSATVVGQHLPADDVLDVDLTDQLPEPSDATSPAWLALRAEPDVRAATGTALLDARAATMSPDEVSAVLRELTAPLAADAAALYRLTAEHRLEHVTSFGHPDRLVRAWAAIPPGVDVPVMRAAVTGTTVALGDAEVRTRLFPRLLTMTLSPYEALVVAPVGAPDAVVGSLALSWRGARTFDAQTLEQAERIARVAGPVLLRVTEPPDSGLRLVLAALGVAFEPWLLLDPVIEDGRTVGFRVRAAAADLPDAADLPGRRLLELWPALGPSGVFAQLLRVERTGVPWVTTLDVRRVDGLPLAGPGTEIRVVRLGTGLLVHWRAARSRPVT